MVGALAVTSFAGVGSAQDPDKLARAVETRQAVFTIIGWNIGPMAGMVKEEVPYDAEVFAKGAERIAFASTMIRDAVRVDTREAEAKTEALPKIWDEFDEFEMLAENLEASSAELVAVAKIGEFDASRSAFLKMAEDCKACHERFRQKK
jgi:cytochrome c556